MGIKTQKIETHWNYFLAIEQDLTDLSQYVEFDKRNFKSFSIEIARVLLTSGAEVDVVCKQICKGISVTSKADNILKYRNEIKPAFPNIPQFKVLMPRFGLTLIPWSEWRKKTGVPLWWTAYNKVKHQRDSEYQKANLKNALNAVAGLFVMVLCLYKEKAQLEGLSPRPQLLHGTAELTGVGGYELSVSYRNL